MAQTGIGEFYTVRKRSSNHGSVKRRKLSEDTRLDIPVLTDGDDTSSIPLTRPEVVSCGGVSVATKPARGRQKRKAGASSGTSRKGRTPRGKGKESEQQTLQTLLGFITRDKDEERQKCSGPLSDVGEELKGKGVLGEDPLPPTDRPVAPLCSQLAPPSLIVTGVSPCKRESSLEPHTPTKIRLVESQPVTTDIAASSSPFKMPQASPLRGRTSRVSSPAKLASPFRTAVRSSPAKTPPRVESRGEALVRLAREKATKSPAKSDKPDSRGSPQVRRKLLAAPEPGASKSFEVTSPKKSQRPPPAYKRFHHLAQPAPPPTPSSPPTTTTPAAAETVDLPLPYKYKELAEKFRCTDTVVTMLQKRREMCTFHKLKQSVQQMTRRTFETRNLGQMKTVYPGAYVFRQEKNIQGNYGNQAHNHYQLTIECDAREGAGGGASEDTGSGAGHLTTIALVQRRKVFNRNLTKIVRRHHQAFLSTLDPPLSIPEERVLRWHPAFPLDTVPDVQEAELPKPPITETYATAHDVLEATQFKMASRVQRALAATAGSGNGSGSGDAEGLSNSTDHMRTLDPALRGLPQALVEKIRQKETAKAETSITRDPVKEKKLEMLARLPDFCRILRIFFVAEKKAAILWDDVVQKLGESHGSGLATERIEEHLAYLHELLPSWVSSVTIRKRRYIKINKMADIKTLVSQLDRAERELWK